MFVELIKFTKTLIALWTVIYSIVFCCSICFGHLHVLAVQNPALQQHLSIPKLLLCKFVIILTALHFHPTTVIN